MKKESQYVRASIKRIYYPMITLRFRKVPPNEFIYPMMELAAQQSGITITEYCRVSVFEKLKRDGYLLPSDEYAGKD